MCLSASTSTANYQSDLQLNLLRQMHTISITDQLAEKSCFCSLYVMCERMIATALITATGLKKSAGQICLTRKWTDKSCALHYWMSMSLSIREIKRTNIDAHNGKIHCVSKNCWKYLGCHGICRSWYFVVLIIFMVNYKVLLHYWCYTQSSISVRIMRHNTRARFFWDTVYIFLTSSCSSLQWL